MCERIVQLLSTLLNVESKITIKKRSKLFEINPYERQSLNVYLDIQLVFMSVQRCLKDEE